MPERTSTTSLPENLRFACRYFPSISAVCRKLGINRQQFNSYLSGTRVPSLFNLRKICDLLGVDEREIFLDHLEFTKVLQGRRGKRSLSTAATEALFRIEGVDDPSSARLSKYAGFYACYYRSCASPDQIIRSFVYVKQTTHEFAVKTVERLRMGPDDGDESFYFRRIGRLFLNTSRLFIVDYESRMNFTPSMTILYPAHRNKFRFLSGIRLDLSSAASQRPFAARVVYDYLGATTDIKAALRASDMYSHDSGKIPEEILRRIDNHLSDSASVLTALD